MLLLPIGTRVMVNNGGGGFPGTVHGHAFAIRLDDSFEGIDNFYLVKLDEGFAPDTRFFIEMLAVHPDNVTRIKG